MKLLEHAMKELERATKVWNIVQQVDLGKICEVGHGFVLFNARIGNEQAFVEWLNLG